MADTCARQIRELARDADNISDQLFNMQLGGSVKLFHDLDRLAQRTKRLTARLNAVADVVEGIGK